MIFVIDVGNTNMTMGVFCGEKLAATFRIMTKTPRTSDEYGIMITQLLKSNGIKTSDIEGAIIASVVPDVMHSLTSSIIRYLHTKPIIVGPGVKSGIKVATEDPRGIGADRIVNAVAAHHMYGDKGNLIIIDFGTATTFCALRPDGEYLGGAIAPGIGISTEALFQKAAKLPRIELIKPKMAICHDTIHAMRSGVIFGFVGQMDGIITRMKKELGGQAFVVVTGGFGKLMASESELVDVVEPFLTLEGLLILHKMNRKQ